MRPLTDDCPKCLLLVGRETILARAVRILVSRGLKRFTVVDGFRGDLIRRALSEDFPDLDFTFVRNDDYATTNNAWSLMLACVGGVAGGAGDEHGSIPPKGSCVHLISLPATHLSVSSSWPASINSFNRARRV